MKEYIRDCITNDIKDILNIRLHMYDVKTTTQENDKDTVCPIYRKEKDATKHVLDCEIELEKGKHTIGSSNISH